MSIKIALTGNPNCGKTTLFNILTGSNQYVGNWPGVTVEKKEGKLKTNKEITVTDLPGIYSLSPYTPEEVVARNYLLNESPDVVLNIIDGTNIERNLYLTTQLAELGIPIVVAVNMMDIVRKNGDKIDIDALSREFGFKFFEISALKNDGITEATQAAIEAAKEKKPVSVPYFSGVVEHAIAHIEEAAVHNMEESKQRWYAIKLFERDKDILQQLSLDSSKLKHIENDILAVEAELDDDAESIITNERYEYITKLTKKCCRKKNIGKPSLSTKIDNIVTNRILALPIFVLIMWAVYTISIGTVGDSTITFMTEGLFGSFAEAYPNTFLAGLPSIPEIIDKFLISADGTTVVAPWLYSLITDGILAGVGSVLGFVPQMLILFLLLALLEDCGYMSRIAFIMDRIFRKFGLSGKSFIPLLVASGCGVPGVMASRTINQERDRRMTIMTTCFIPCGAKMPIVGFIAGALFGGSSLIATASYFIGVMAVILSGIILKKTKAFSGKAAPFVMELPAYHAPVAANVFRATWERGWGFIKKAGTVILAASIIIWILNSLSFTGGLHYITNDSDGDSILKVIGTGIAWIFIPLGFGKWQAAVATILGLVAKEEVVGVFGSLSSMAQTATEAGEALAGIQASDISAAGAEFFDGKLGGFSFLIFNLLCAPCFAAMGAIRREMNSAKWTFAAIGYMCIFAYAISLIIYQAGKAFTDGIFSTGTIAAIAILAVMIYLIFRKDRYKS